MRNNTIKLVSLCLILLSTSCQPPANHFNVEVTWEVVSNTQGEDPTVLSNFTLHNKGNVTLNETNWAMFFNQSPRKAISTGIGSASNALVEQISGDWYRLYPTQGFSLKPNQSVTISYETNNWLIKESDAPAGLYFVTTSPEGNEIIEEVSCYKVLPFSREEQMRRHRGDYEALPTPQNAYETNASVSLIAKDNLIRIVPTPVSLELGKQNITLTSPITIYSNSPSLSFELNYLKEQMESLLGWDVLVTNELTKVENSIQLSITSETRSTPESYTLQVLSKRGIRIAGSTQAGVFYGIQSMLSLLPIESVLEHSKKIEIPSLTVKDWPRFGYRGVHVDVCRNFMPKERIKKTIDILAYYKINRLHLHLTEDEAWRLEIAALPELTEVGAKRVHTTKSANAVHPSYGSGPFSSLSGSGFFSRNDFIEILRYANQRHIQVIPEINMPGHCRAAIKSMEARYQRFMEKGDEAAANEYRLVDPEDQSVYLSAQHFTDNIANVARESVYRFFETVVDEVTDMYKEANAPLSIMHVGGDEVPRGAWTKSPMIEELMKQRPDIKHYENMHAYFTERAMEILGGKGLRMAGWEEIALHTNNGHVVNPQFANGNTIPFVWNSLWGAQDLAYRLANRGYPVVMSHVTNFYFDLAYNNHPEEPGLYWAGFVNTRSAWHYNPFDIFKSTLKDNMGQHVDIDKEYKGMERLKPESQKNILGLQAQLWSETIRNPQMLDYYLLPKLVGFAQSAWTKERRWEVTENKLLREKQVAEDWNTFANTLAQKEMPRLSKLFGGYNYRVPTPGAKVDNGILYTNVEFPGLQVRYTTDGSEPTINSAIYKEPVTVKSDVIKLKAFDPAGRQSRTVKIEIN